MRASHQPETSHPADSVALMRLHLEALLADGARPRFFLGRTADGNHWRIRRDVPGHVALALEQRARHEAAGFRPEPESGEFEPYLGLLSADAPVEHVWSGPVYRFPEEIPETATAVRVTAENASVLIPYLEEWLPDVESGVPMAAYLVEGRAVSLCCTACSTEHAHEAGVETHPRFRRQGFAARVVPAWATFVRGEGAVPLYSTSWENGASRALAASAGLIQYGSTAHAR